MNKATAIILVVIAALATAIFIMKPNLDLGVLLPKSESNINEVQECMNTCTFDLSKGVNLSSGPCLREPLDNNADWVCDVAHSPRQAVDEDPANQCATFREGRTHHFVEITANCDLIRAM